MVDVMIGVWTQLVWLECVESEDLTRLTNHKRRYMMNRGIPQKLRSSGDEHH